MNNEPVAWIDPRELDMEVSTTVTKNKWDKDDIPLYTHPAKTLTEEEIAQAKLEATSYKGIYDNQGNGIGQTKYVNDRLFVEAILRKAQEK
jgi:hypothetical protein